MTRALITALLLVGALASGCGDGDDGSDAQTPSSTPDNDDNGTDSGDDSGDSGDDAPEAGELPKFCELLTAEQVTEAVGAPVTLESAPFDSCEFDQEDPRAVSGSLGVVEVGVDAGGFESYRSGSSGALTNGVDHPVDGLGNEAFVATGTIGGGESLQAGGGVLTDGGVVYTVNLTQASGVSEDDLVAISTRLLELLVEVG
ncbi:hypothetical protein ASE01_03605 [Nocardioides sp. Root190]|uniref:hypothetical protein n=1 Tax=Nocardioides sp. Root190 TaxID=1736488 RepID=UPI0006F666DD|nr:hypothetical protein [Nocardioides sp. Root190]KRB78372.1 hypothetical protein ASE01_03605 [Nocardioides sp. Root190]